MDTATVCPVLGVLLGVSFRSGEGPRFWQSPLLFCGICWCRRSSPALAANCRAATGVSGIVPCGRRNMLLAGADYELVMLFGEVKLMPPSEEFAAQATC